MKPIYKTAIKDALIISAIFIFLGMIIYITSWSGFFSFLILPILGVVYTQIKCLRIEKNSSFTEISIAGSIFLSCIYLFLIVGSMCIPPSFPSFKSFLALSSFIIPILLMYLFIGTTITALYRIFEKAGRDGKEALIPFYNIYVLNEIVKLPKRYSFLILIPVVNIVYLIILFHKLSKAFGQDAMFTVGLCLLGFIFFPLLAFGRYDYQMQSIKKERDLQLTKLVMSAFVEEVETNSTEKERGLQFSKLVMSAFVEEVDPNSTEKGLQLSKLIMSAFVVDEEVQPPSKA